MVNLVRAYPAHVCQTYIIYDFLRSNRECYRAIPHLGQYIKQYSYLFTLHRYKVKLKEGFAQKMAMWDSKSTEQRRFESKLLDALIDWLYLCQDHSVDVSDVKRTFYKIHPEYKDCILKLDAYVECHSDVLQLRDHRLELVINRHDADATQTSGRRNDKNYDFNDDDIVEELRTFVSSCDGNRCDTRRLSQFYADHPTLRDRMGRLRLFVNRHEDVFVMRRGYLSIRKHDDDVQQSQPVEVIPSVVKCKTALTRNDTQIDDTQINDTQIDDDEICHPKIGEKGTVNLLIRAISNSGGVMHCNEMNELYAHHQIGSLRAFVGRHSDVFVYRRNSIRLRDSVDNSDATVAKTTDAKTTVAKTTVAKTTDAKTTDNADV